MLAEKTATPTNATTARRPREGTLTQALEGSLRDFRAPPGSNLMERGNGFYDWQQTRKRHGLWTFARSTSSAPKPRTEVLDDANQPIVGVNFASQDYLSLSSHPAVAEAAMATIKDYGVHSAGSAALLGNTRLSLLLEKDLSEFLNDRAVVLYPTGWSAGFAAIQGFVRPNDHVVLDVLSHSCLQEGARAATQNIYFHGHLNIEGLRRRLERIRARDTQNGILVVTESLFSMHADTPDIAQLRAICDEFGAQLVVDCAHDFGCIGPNGLGHLELQRIVDSVDIIVGSFSKTFASNGGFIAVKSRAAAEYLKYMSATHTFTNALSPMQAAIVRAAMGVVRSEEGAERRRRLMGNIVAMRQEFSRRGVEAIGDPSPIVPVRIGHEGPARLAARRISAHGAIVNLVEYPAVPQGSARFRLQVMADHSPQDVELIVNLVTESIRDAEQEYRQYREADPERRDWTVATPAADAAA